MKHLKHIRRVLCILATALLLPGCARQDEIDELKDTAVPLTVFAEINDNGTATRADKSAFASGDAIGVTGSGHVNVKYTYDGAKWSAASEETTIYPSAYAADLFTAYYNYDSSYSDGEITISTTDGGASWADILFAKANKTGRGSVDFSFTHLLSKLTITVTTSKSITACYISGVKTKGTLNLTTGELTVSDEIAVTALSSSSVYYAYLLPQDVSAILMDFVSSSETVNRVWISIPDKKLRSGYNYTCSVTI